MDCRGCGYERARPGRLLHRRALLGDLRLARRVRALLGARVAPARGDKHKGPTTHTKASDLPADFVDAFAAYAKLDDALYARADELLTAHVARFPACAPP